MNNNIHLARFFLFFIAILSVTGCLRQIPNIMEYTNYWVERPVYQMKELVSRRESYASRIGCKEKTYTLENGNWVYVEPDSPGCFIPWEVNPNGIIVGYKLEGNCY